MTSETSTLVSLHGVDVPVVRRGSGPPILVLHGGEGLVDHLPFAERISSNFELLHPTHPGFDGTPIPEHFDGLEDLTFLYLDLIDSLDLQDAILVGFSMGGWLAAEMAVMCSHAFSKLMLVDAVGIKPQQGEIADIFIISPTEVTALAYHDPKQAPEYDQLYGQTPTPEQVTIAEGNREMTVRLCWKPYMYDLRLPQLLGRVNIPTRIVWGREDQIVPAECAQLYHQAIPGSDLVIIDNCGHVPQVEKPDEFVKTALEFMA